MAGMFNGCRSLTSLNLSNFDTSFTEEIECMFCDCSSLEYLDISNFNFMNLFQINDMFNGINNKLKYISINNIKSNQYALNDLNSAFNNQSNLMVCQKDNIITNEKVTYCCCDFSKSPLKCDCNNYINVKYINRVEYDNGFINNKIQSRNDISFIINKDSLLLKDEPFIIEANSSIDIVISNPITKLDNFFNSDFDEYSGSISYVDLSHFNASLVTSTIQMFEQCYSIKEINFTNIQTPSIQTMIEMFSGCSQLISLDLSNFDTSSVTQMGEMFRGCSSLEYLDISSFDAQNLKSFSDMFDDADNIKYISLYNAKNPSALSEAISKYSNLNTKNELTVCQKEDIINNENALNACCDYWDYNFETLSCDPDNYIKLKFKEDVNYPYGFSFIQNNQKQNEFRTEIYLIQYDHIRYKQNEALNISKDKDVKIVFNSLISTTTKFFYDYYDPNVEYIISMDLSHFNSSLLESSDSMFSGCTSLESIDLVNFNAPLLTNMNNMFFQCNSLKNLDLSDFKSSSLTNINRMFCGCVSLEYLNLNNLDFSKIEDASYMFYNVKHLKFINIYDIKYNDIFKNEIDEFSRLNDSKIYISQNSDIITNENHKYFDYNINMNEYKCSSFIIIYYKDSITYEKGFLIDGIDSRNYVSFIFNDNVMYLINEKLDIKENGNVKLCFKDNVTSLEKFFDASIDNNAKNIISIDLSHFDSSLVTNIEKMFSECQELLALDISNFNFEKIENSNDIFNGLTNLTYINLFNSKNINNINISELMNLTLIVCQNDMFLNSTDYKYICCDFNLELKRCHSNNYIIAKYIG